MKLISIWGRGPSAKRLAKELGCRMFEKAAYVIRWRWFDPIPFKCQEINRIEAIRAASHKFKSLKIMEEKGVRVPRADGIRDLEQLHFPILGRKNYHTKGTDIVYFNKIEAFIQDDTFEDDTFDYFIEYLKPSKEYRYHVAFHEVILATVKVKPDGTYTDNSIVRNYQGGEWRQVVTPEVRPSVAEQAIRAVDSLGLDFGAVDIIIHKKRPYVLEVNTAPGLVVENRVMVYAEALKENLK